jgi:CCR4-NOT transcription complex subunit 6
MLLSNLKKPLAVSVVTQKQPSLIKQILPSTSKVIESLNINNYPSSSTSSSTTTTTTTTIPNLNFPLMNKFSANTILNHRHLIDLNKIKNLNKTITISSYNILSRHYLWESLYNYLPLEFTNWKYRFKRLNKNFIDLTKLSDIMCFQEMEYQIYKDYWKDFLKNENFDSIYFKKSKPEYWKKSANMMDGVSIFYNNKKFDLLNYEQINFANHFKNSSIIEQTFDTQTRLNIRNTVAIILVLKHKFTNEILFISNTHLYWSPKHDDVKLMQTYLLTNLIKKSIMRYYKINSNELNYLIENKKGPNIIMVGDFNSNPNSMVYKFLSNGFINKNDESTFIQNYGPNINGIIKNNLGNFQSPYKDLYAQGIFNKTTYTPKFKDVIDYMWFANCNNNFKFTKVLGDIDQNYLKDYKGFPNNEFPSDHIPILSQFEFN